MHAWNTLYSYIEKKYFTYIIWYIITATTCCWNNKKKMLVSLRIYWKREVEILLKEVPQ